MIPSSPAIAAASHGYLRARVINGRRYFQGFECPNAAAISVKRFHLVPLTLQ
jgi:hypothetical protein